MSRLQNLLSEQVDRQLRSWEGSPLSKIYNIWVPLFWNKLKAVPLYLRSYGEALKEKLRTLSLNLKFEFRTMFLSFKPSKSHNRLTRICDIADDPTVIHEVWKQFLERHHFTTRLFPLCCWQKRLNIWHENWYLSTVSSKVDEHQSKVKRQHRFCTFHTHHTDISTICLITHFMYTDQPQD